MRTRNEDFNPAQLRRLRHECGLTLSRLASLCRLGTSTIFGYESGRSQPSAAMWKRIKRVLLKKRVNTPSFEQTKPQPAAKLEAAAKFEVGHKYSIHSQKRGTRPIGYAGGVHVDMMSVFKYEGKQGIHHYFREASGGWTRTYTDAQLIGKEIKEV